MKHHINQCILLNPKGWLSELTIVVPTEKKDTFLDQIINEEIENVMFKSQSFVHAVLMSTLYPLSSKSFERHRSQRFTITADPPENLGF